MKFSTLAVALFASTTLVSVSSKKFKGDRLTAVFDFGDLQATVVVEQNKNLKALNVANWKVKINKFNEALCPSGELNWHVHEYPGTGIRDVGAAPDSSAPLCAPDVTGGHYDPTFACGGASQNNAGVDSDGEKTGGVCAVLRATDQVPEGEGYGKVKAADSYDSCKPDNQSSCEIGDQSGKLGKLSAFKKNLTPKQKKKGQRFTDKWMTPIDATLTGKSLVLRCCSEADGCGPRLACANLESRTT
mmetsp:Transcript_5364/g.5218  ORF Transcript_5364/g.5218 Transcript_5364/m.5218 type:complete len:245 (+) Transcript_5364:234-968(+)